MNCNTSQIPIDSRTLVLVVQNAEPATDAEWAASLPYLRQALEAQNGDRGRVCACIISDGGGLDANQRNDLLAALKGRNQAAFRLACITRSMFVRGMLTALSWFNGNLKPFAPDDVASAFFHLRIEKPDRERVMREIERLAATIGGSRAVAAMRAEAPA